MSSSRAVQFLHDHLTCRPGQAVRVTTREDVLHGVVESSVVRRGELRVALAFPEPVQNGSATAEVHTPLGPMVLKGSLVRWSGSTSELGVESITSPEVPDWTPVPGVSVKALTSGGVVDVSVVRASGRKVWIEGAPGLWRGDTVVLEVRGHRLGAGALRVPGEVEDTRGDQARLLVLNSSSTVSRELKELQAWLLEVQREVLWRTSAQG
jgi:hypothetical protein